MVKFYLGLVFFCFAASVLAAEPEAKPGEVIIIRNPHAPQAATDGEIKSLGLSAKKVAGSRIERVSLPQTASLTASQTTKDIGSLNALCEELILKGIAIKCSPNFRYKASRTVPNDPTFSALWGLEKIQAPSAWDYVTGSNSVVVAVIDSGIQLNHPDLAANLWVNPNEIANTGIDNDGNGYVDDRHGYNWVSNNGDPNDDNGHGTHCAGTIGGVGNNGVGVSGVNFNVKLQALKVLDDEGSGWTSDIAAAVEYASLNGAHVINLSLGGPGYSSLFEDAIREAGERGVLVVAAAGNESEDNDSTPSYPASFDLPNVISVAASDENDVLADFSNYGQTVHIAAPGVDILSTYPTSSYEYLDGTSMAAPHVAGAAALVKAANFSLSVGELRSLLISQADVVSSLGSWISGNRRLNVFRSVTAALGVTPVPRTDPTANRLTLKQKSLGRSRHRLSAFAFSRTGSFNLGVRGVRVTISCSERGGRKVTKKGRTNSKGLYNSTLKFSRSSRVSCRATAGSLRSKNSSFQVR